MARRRSRSRWQVEGERAARELAQRPTTWIPVRSAEHWEEEGRVVVMAPRFRNRLGKAMVDALGREQTYNLRLDDYGTFVWHNIDGRRTAVDISRKLVEHYGEEVEPAVPRLLEFLQSLYNVGAITVTSRENSEVGFK